MNKILIIFCLLFISNSFSQPDNEIKFLEYANIEFEVPKNCSTNSKYELLDCDGISTQWIYFDEAMLKSASEKLIKQFSKNSISKEPIEVISFGSTLRGYKFTYKNPENQHRIIVSGTVNKQPLILNVASKDELIGFSNLNSFLKKIIKF